MPARDDEAAQDGCAETEVQTNQTSQPGSSCPYGSSFRSDAPCLSDSTFPVDLLLNFILPLRRLASGNHQAYRRLAGMGRRQPTTMRLPVIVLPVRSMAGLSIGGMGLG
jgi:hypothetical protein